MSPAARRILLSVIAIVIIAGLVGVWIIRGPDPMAFAGGPRVALSEYHDANPTGVPAALAQASLVDRGEYLATAADCMVCHTTQGGKEYAGGLGFKLPFGTLYSTNITPDKETGIGNYSDQDFLNAVQRGIRRDGARLYPAMPYTSYTYISDADALAIKAYLFSLPPVRAAAPANTLAFPFNQRWAMMFWSALFNPDTRYEPDTSKSSGMEPRRLSRRSAGALRRMPHAAKSRLCARQPQEIRRRHNRGLARLQHHLRQGQPASAAGVTKTSSPISRSDTRPATAPRQGRWAKRSTTASASSRRKTFAPSSPICAACPPSPRPICRRPWRHPRRPSHKDGGGTQNARGKMVFEGACVSCHGWTGESAISPMATLTGAWAVNDPGATNVAQIVISGTKRHTPEGALSMPAFGNAYSDDEIAAVANYVTARFGAKGSTLTAQDVAELRKQTAQ